MLCKISRSIQKWPFEENRRGCLFRKSPIYEVMSKKTWSSSPENFVQRKFEFSNFYNIFLKTHNKLHIKVQLIASKKAIIEAQQE
jgi:hypothetical protein